jgi:hypothetical protein
MKAWVEPDENRLRPQEAALLALCDRMTVLEQAFTAELDRHVLTRKRLDHVQKELNAALARQARLEADHRALFNILGRE